MADRTQTNQLLILRFKTYVKMELLNIQLTRMIAPKNSQDRADSEYVSCIGVDCKEVTNKCTHSQTNIHTNTQLYILVPTMVINFSWSESLATSNSSRSTRINQHLHHPAVPKCQNCRAATHILYC